MENVNENVIEFLRDSKTATVTFCQGRYITRIKELAKKKPNECVITAQNKDSIVAHIPTSWIRIIPNREYSEEVLEKYRESARQRFHRDKACTLSE